METKAWHFIGKTLRDGRPIPPVGGTLKYNGKLKLCRYGLHASLTPYDALAYAPGPTLCLVECGGEIIYGEDKLVCAERTILKQFDITELLQDYARWCALCVVHLWNCPSVVLEFLKTGNVALAKRAKVAAWDAAWARADGAVAAWAAARDAADGALQAARSARDAAWAARSFVDAGISAEFNNRIYKLFEV